LEKQVKKRFIPAQLPPNMDSFLVVLSLKRSSSSFSSFAHISALAGIIYLKVAGKDPSTGFS
jgi:hypothetical protein